MRNNHKDKKEEDIIRIEGGIPRIVDDKTFEGVKAIISGRKKIERNGQAKETYLLAGKIFCGECGHAFGGARKVAGRNKHLYVTYRCFNRDRTADTACCNKEIQRDKIENFVLNEMVDKLFNEANYKQWLKEYNRDKAARERAGGSRLQDMEQTVISLDAQISNMVLTITQNPNTSRAMYDMLNRLETQKQDIENEIARNRNLMKVVDITEEDMRTAYTKAREMLKSGTLPELRQLINLYVEKVVVYREHVEVFFHVLPVFSYMNHIAIERGDTSVYTLYSEVMQR
jgi:site-specific DNA recombinase